MGMFDTVDVRNNPLGIPYTDKDYNYQTKCLECNLHTYGFTDSGKLVLLHTLDAHAEYRAGNVSPQDVDVTDEINIYTNVEENAVGVNWVEFDIVLDHGQVVSVESHSSLPIHELQRAFDTQRINYGDSAVASRTAIDGEAFEVHPTQSLPPP